MKKGYYFIIFISLFIFTSNVYADVCDKEHINQLKELAKNVDVNYEYIDNSENFNSDEDDGAGFIINLYSVSVNLISDELYISNGNKNYYYSSSDNGLINFHANAGILKLDVKSRRCAGYSLRKMSIDLPKFNTYSYREECEELDKYDVDVCDPWYQGEVDDDIFDEVVKKYLSTNEGNKNNFFNKYYLLVIGVLFFVICIVIALINYRKRSVLE